MAQGHTTLALEGLDSPTVDAGPLTGNNPVETTCSRYPLRSSSSSWKVHVASCSTGRDEHYFILDFLLTTQYWDNCPLTMMPSLMRLHGILNCIIISSAGIKWHKGWETWPDPDPDVLSR